MSGQEGESGAKLDEEVGKEVDEQTLVITLEKTKDEDQEEKTDESTPEDENGEEVSQKNKVIDYTPKAHICANQVDTPAKTLFFFSIRQIKFPPKFLPLM